MGKVNASIQGSMNDIESLVKTEVKRIMERSKERKLAEMITTQKGEENPEDNTIGGGMINSERKRLNDLSLQISEGAKGVTKSSTTNTNTAGGVNLNIYRGVTFGDKLS